MTAEYIKNKIEQKAKMLDNTNCLIVYCQQVFSAYFTTEQIIDIINNANKDKDLKSYQSFFHLGN